MTSQVVPPPVTWKNSMRWFDGRGRSLGMWAFILNRVTGLLLVAYIFVHFVVISSLYQGEAAWNNLMTMFRSPFALLFDVGLILALLLHGLNGVRIILLAFNVGVKHHKAIFWGLMGLSVIILAAASLRLFTK